MLNRPLLNPPWASFQYWGVILVMVVVAFGLLVQPSQAQLTFHVETESGVSVEVSGDNRIRTDNTLILYTSDYGDSTRTNPYGVEVVAVQTDPIQGSYEVKTVSQYPHCKKTTEPTCGNADIPPSGIVLSAAGSKRPQLLDNLRPGDLFYLKKEWFQERAYPISVVDPTPITNPKGSGFPGVRGSNQLILYDRHYGYGKTGTNEFGYEVTVVPQQDAQKNTTELLVVEHEGSDSSIPVNGFVLSGHGRARNWLIANTPIGAKINFSTDDTNGKQVVVSTVDSGTYRYQLQRRMEQAKCIGVNARHLCEQRYVTLGDIRRLELESQHEQAAELATNTLTRLNKALWSEYPAFPAQAVKGMWHRPVETSRKEVAGTLDFFQKAGINTLYLETFFHGFTIFPSKTYDAYGLPNQYPKFTQASGGFDEADPLKVWIEEAHKRDIALHVWFETFYAGNKGPNGKYGQETGPILAKYPQWANVQYSSKGHDGPSPSTLELGSFFLDPANYEVQAFVLKLVEEMVTNYDLDGVQLDYIRYPSSFPKDRYSYLKTTWGYTPVSRAEFKKNHDFDPILFTKKNYQQEHQAKWRAWESFKVDQVNRFVRQTSELIETKKPSVKLSAVVFAHPEESLVRKHQEWKTWSEQGWVDYLVPITITSAVKVVRSDIEQVVNATHNKTPVVAGVFGPFNSNSTEHLLDQIDAARMSGAGGFAIFDSAHFTGQMAQALKASQASSKQVGPGLPPTP
ncbi:MAG: family 10 glycosylhydrolase [Vampirovibrio sp.]|nr:family 10 glycosylhydrolase [Vampirovibrio sp.]